MANLMGVITWIVGILVSLAVGAQMILANTVAKEGLFIPGIPDLIVHIAGWVVVVGAIISVIMAIFNK